jgi:trimethylamine:corrinoid methyltransferase-like protein
MPVMAPKKSAAPEPSSGKRKKSDFDVDDLRNLHADALRALKVIGEYLQEADEHDVETLHFEGASLERAVESLRTFRKLLPDAVDNAVKQMRTIK